MFLALWVFVGLGAWNPLSLPFAVVVGRTLSRSLGAAEGKDEAPEPTGGFVLAV